MTTLAEICPNVPDVIPEYVDVISPSRPAAARRTPEHARPGNAGVEVPPARREPEALSHRDGECVPNIPDARPDVVDEMLAAARANAAPEEIPGSRTRSPTWMKWSVAATVLAAAALGVLVFSQAISTLALAASLPAWAEYMLLIPLIVCCLAVLGAGVLLVMAWLRLRAVRQVDMRALEDLHARAQSRRDGIEHFQEARLQLEEYLRKYPLDAAGAARLETAGVKPGAVETLALGRDYLVGRSTDSRSWLADYRGRFQSTLDEAAAKRVNSWSVKAAGCVIASPLPLLDAVLVSGIAFKMMKDLCFIYNVRTSRAGSLVLLKRAVVAAFIAGAAGEATEIAGGMAAGELSGLLGEGALASMGAKTAGVIAPKLGEGAINAFFIRRLGKAAIRMLQPLRPQ